MILNLLGTNDLFNSPISLVLFVLFCFFRAPTYFLSFDGISSASLVPSFLPRFIVYFLFLRVKCSLTSVFIALPFSER